MGLSRLALTATFPFALAACADVPAELDATESAPAASEDDGAELEGEFAEKVACGSRWALPSNVVTEGDAQAVPYDSAGSRCSGGPTEGAQSFATFIRAEFPDLIDLDIPGRGVQIYNCRRVVGGSSLSMHATGRGVDIFIPTGSGGAADNTRGDVIANWLVENAQRIGVQMIIWDRTLWKASGGAPRNRCYQGSHPHNDHLHVELTQEAGDLETPFFQGDQSGPEDPPAEPPVETPEAPPINRDSWIGDACRTDNDCGFSTDDGLGRCFVDHTPASGVGFCTVDCAGYCPDRTGRAMTFCVPADAAGGTSGHGVCVAKSREQNAWCSNPAGFETVTVTRYVGGSGVSRSSADVCLPTER